MLSTHVGISMFIIQKGDTNGWTCLQIASASGHLNIVRHLVEERKNFAFSVIDETPDNPLQLARERVFDDLVCYFCEQINHQALGPILENVGDPIILIQNYTTIIGYNQAAETLLGYKKHDVIGLPSGVIFPDPLSDYSNCETVDLLGSLGNVVRVEISIAQMTGGRELVTLRSSSTSAIHQIVRSMNDAVVLADRFGIIVGFNAAAENLFGYKEKEVLSKPVDVLIWDETIRSAHPSFIHNYHETGKTRLIGKRRAVYVRSKNKEKIQVEILLSELEDKKLLGCFRSIRDASLMEYELEGRLPGGEEYPSLDLVHPHVQYFVRPSFHFLIHTCEAGDVDGLISLKEYIVQCVNESDYEGCSALHYAARGGSLACCKILVEECGANPNVYDSMGITPSMVAQERGHNDIFEYLGTHLGCGYVSELTPTRTKEETSKPSTRKMAVGSTELLYGEQLGSGKFGVVFKGKWRYVPVAIKKVKVPRYNYLEDLLQEALLMLELRPHPNVVSLLGVCTEPTQQAIIMEFLSGGSLDKVLQNPSELNNDCEKCIVLLDVALGMAHLHQEGIIHCDLAARNVLLTNERPRRAKISDFGFAKVIDKHGNYEHKGGAVRWMAPEALVKNRFGTKSDVWSYGILCYEVFARSSPHPGWALVKVMQEIGINGATPKMSDKSPDWMCELTKKCWDLQPSQRPDFPDIIAFLSDRDFTQV